MAEQNTMDYRCQLANAVYIHGCYRELLALKPGNVGMHAGGHRMTVDHFQHSARVSARPLCKPDAELGSRILAAVQATREMVGCNTNLGIILLCSPILQAYIEAASEQSLRHAVEQILNVTTVQDARLCYEAIRIASPGGLGKTSQHDVQQTPDISLLEAMQAAACYDRIAFQYANGFVDIFNYSIPRLIQLRDEFPSQDNWAVSALYLALLARYPDTHIVRKQGADLAQQVSEQAKKLETDLLKQGPTMAVQQQLEQVDQDWKNAGINPGTTADMVVATLVAEELDTRFAEKQMDGLPDKLQEVEQYSFSTNKHLKEVHYGSNQSSNGR